MKKLLTSITLALFLLASLPLMQSKLISTVNASPSIYQGNLILTGNNVTTITGRFDINGSIIIEENATLNLIDAILNFTQTKDRQYNITLINPSNGNPRLSAFNSTITSDYEIIVYPTSNSTATIEKSTIPWIIAADYSLVTIAANSLISVQYAYDSSVANIYNSTIQGSYNYGSPHTEAHDSQISSLLIGSTSIEANISNHKPELMSYWNFLTNCSVNILPGGTAPDITLINTEVNDWRIGAYGSSHMTINNSKIGDLATFGSSQVSVYDSAILSYVYARDTSVTSLINSTYSYISGIDDEAQVQIAWYLDIHVTDSISQDVPSADVTAYYENDAIADSKPTAPNGWARLILNEKTMNDTGTYPLGNYTIEAIYGIYSSNTTTNITGNKQLTTTLGFIIPEFPQTLMIPIFMIITLLAATIYKRVRNHY